MSYISSGPTYQFSGSDGADYVKTELIDSTHFIVAYSEGTNDVGTALIGTISGHSISYGSSAIFNSSNTKQIGMCLLDSTHVVIAYSETTGYDCYAIVGTISGSTITFGSPTLVSNSYLNSTQLLALDSSTFVMVFIDPDSTDSGYAAVGTVSETTITMGSFYLFSGTELYSYLSAAKLSSTKFVVASPKGLAYIGTVSGTVITFGTGASFGSINSISSSIAAIDSTKFILTWRNYEDSSVYVGKSVVGTVSDSTITFGTIVPFYTQQIKASSTLLVDSSNFLIWFTSPTNAGYVVQGEVSGTTLTFGSYQLFNNQYTVYLGSELLDSTHYLVSYSVSAAFGVSRICYTANTSGNFMAFFN